MTTPPKTQSIQQLREDFASYPNVDTMGLAAAKLIDRLEAAEAQLKSIGIALEWPGQDDRTLLEVVKEAACDGTFLVEARAELHRMRTAQQPRPMSEAPDNECILAKCDGAWVEVIFEDGSWGALHGDDTALPLTCWLPLPDQAEAT